MLPSSSARTTLTNTGMRKCLVFHRDATTTRQLVTKTTTRRHLSSSSTTTKSSSSSSSSGGFLAWYSGLLDTHPLMTKTLTSGLIAGTGDFLCQWLIRDNCDKNDNENNSKDDNEKDENDDELLFQWDKARTGRFGFLGFALVAPCIHFWYEALNRWLPGTKAVVIAKRVFLDQFVYTPIFLPIWLGSLWSLERLDPNLHHSDIDNKVDHVSYTQRLAESLPDIIMANWSLWIPVMTLNFRFVPLKYQVLTSNIVALLWNCYLSFSTSRSRKALVEEVAEKET